MDEPVFSISNKQFLVYALNKKGIADLQNNQIIDDKEILSFCLSPLGNEIITISKNKIKKYSLGETIEEVLNKKINFKSDVKKIISDQFGNKYFILFENGKLFILDKSLRTSEVNSNEKIIDVSWSDNLESVFILTKSSIKRYRNEAFFETKPLSKTASLISSINQFYRIAIGFQDGSFSIFSQNLKNEIINIKVSNSPVNSIVNHPEDPHLFVGNLLGELYSFNLLSNKLTFINKIHEREIGLRSVNSSFKNIKKEYLVSYGNDSKIKIWDIKNYEPDFKKFVDDKLEIVKNQFYKIKLNENEAEFTKRTSSDRSSKYFRVVRQNMIDSIAKTKYDENYLIEEEGDSIQLTIYPFKSISLLKSDGIFSDFLKLTNVNFEINQLNFFEIKNFNLYDQSSGKNLLFNPGLDKEIELANIEKEKRNVRIAQKISRQELSLKNELTKLVSDMQLKGEINKVDLSVNSKLVKEKDSTGTEELNLKIAFLSKGVRAEAAASTSDYAPGKYNLFDSPSAKTLVQFFLRSTKDKLYQYLVNGNRVTFKITGSTDKSRVNSALPYDNEYGPFKNVPYYSQGLLEGMNLDRYTGIKSNSELGFLRTVAVKDFIINNTDLFDLTKNKFILYSEESEKLGPEYRKVSIEMTIHSIDKLMSLEKTKNEILSDVDVNIPKTNTVLNAFALIIGNEDYASYQSGLSIGQNVPFANRDAISFKNYLMQMYNIPEKQILILVDGSLASMREKILQFKSLMDMNNDSGDNNQFIFYYSGHGMPSETTGDPFIMPVDVSAYTVDEAISLNKLLIDFSRYDKQKTTVIVDACFSGISRSPEPLIKVRGVGSKKLEKRSKNKSSNKSYFNYYKPVSYRDINYINPNIGKNMMLISSSSGDETSLTWDDKQHGLFTYFLLKSLQKSGGNISNEKLFYEVKKEVRIKSIFDFGGRKQTPEVLYGEQFKKDNQFLKND
tara:strand:+ start:235 stop:3099 length:2865 start_codon:yes stop_codon:yes gene_type:complete